jgi:nicotinamide phosphoribosyltransferase
LVKVDGEYQSVPRDSVSTEENLLKPVFRNGRLLKKWDFSELVANSEAEVPESYYADVIAPMLAPRETMLTASEQTEEKVLTGIFS